MKTHPLIKPKIVLSIIPFFLAAILLVQTFAWAAPFPVSSSSILTDPQKGLFLQRHGFNLNTKGTKWTLSSEPGESAFESYQYRLNKAGSSEKALLSLRMDQLEKSSTLEAYAKKWMKEYPQFGYEVLGTRQLKFGGGQGLLVDLVQKNKGQQVRQLILGNGKKIAILTCTDDQKSFKSTLTDCNDILNTFKWVSPK